MKTLHNRGLFIAISGLLGWFTVPAHAQCPQLVWADEFEGSTVDFSKWSVLTGDGCSINLCGWGNNELQWYQAQNAVVSAGTLKITARSENVGNRRYTSARLRSMGKGDWTYGRFEARIKLPTGKGIWPAFWMLPTDEVYGFWPQSGEIDIMELVGSEPATVHGTIHFGQPIPNNKSQGDKYRLYEGIFNGKFHVFAIEWDSERIRWYVDDYLFLVKTRNDVSPSRWPFDQRFHLLLNLAVGGNWPGAPDGNTVFPQTMEVDYVRVYNGIQPYLMGKRLVANRARGEIYSIDNAPAGSTFNWIVPAGATLVSGQGTRTIQVDWGVQSGQLAVETANTCGSKRLVLDVVVEQPYVQALALENFDDPAKISFSSATGTLADNTANPSPDAINGSALCGRYSRNGSQQYDVLIYKTAAISDGSEFVSRKKRFYFDIYTNAPPGTQILLQLENSSRARSNNYPAGRHSRFEARTSKQGAWERLEFSFLDQPDPGTASNSIDQLIFLFASNSFTANTYHFDNFDVYAQGAVTGIFSPLKEAGQLNLYPNPTGEQVTIEDAERQDLHAVTISDLTGRIWRRIDGSVLSERGGAVALSGLPPGFYLVRGTTRLGGTLLGRFIKQ